MTRPLMGDPRVKLNFPRGELGRVVAGINAVLDRLSAMVTDIKHSIASLPDSEELSGISNEIAKDVQTTSDKSDLVAASTTELTNNMQTLTGSFDEIATGINMLATAVEEISATIGEITQNSEKARGVTEKALEKAKNASESVDNLGSAAQKIGKVTETITEISEQTNLLALNATIEAARAGTVKAPQLALGALHHTDGQIGYLFELVGNLLQGFAFSQSRLSGNQCKATVLGHVLQTKAKRLGAGDGIQGFGWQIG